MAGLGSRLFLPGFAAPAHVYTDGLPAGWEAPQPPSHQTTGGSFAALRDWAAHEVSRRPGPTLVAGHSMGAALAVLVAAAMPEQVGGLLLIAPAGLPIRKPLRRSARDLVRQIGRGTYSLSDVRASTRELVGAPRGAVRLVRTLRRLDLSVQMERVRAFGIPATVIGCTTDTLVTPSDCRRTARLLGGVYRELELPDGHVWMLTRPLVLAAVLRNGTE